MRGVGHGARLALAPALAVAMAAALPAPAGAAGAPDLGTEAQRAEGRTLYETYCSQCHGDTGDGEGPAAVHLRPRPRNFTTAKFKVRTTPNGALPTTEDLKAIIRRGMPYTSMPPWPDLSDDQLASLAYYIKTFAPEFSNAELVPELVPLPAGPAATDETVAQGKTVYEESGCVGCHGALGRGDGTSAPTLVDDWGHPIAAADLTQPWTFRAGARREDVFRTLSTGLNGTPMPSFLDALTPEQRWALTDYILSLAGSDGPRYADLVVAKRTEDPIDLALGAQMFDGVPAARLPLVGQIMEPGRSFHPPATFVLVQAVYNADAIALRVRWHDMSAQTSGRNGPDLPVPREEEEEGAGAPPAAGGAAEDIWGEEAAEPAVAPGGGDDFWEEDGAAAEAPAAGSEFSDAVAVQFPAVMPSGARKPYFLFGDAQSAVDLWFFDLARREPQQFAGRGSADLSPNDSGEVTGVASYEAGEWSVIFTRPLRATSGVALAPAQFVPVAFSVWDGFTRERGSRRALTLWSHLYTEPGEAPSPLGPMIRTALAVLAIELALVGWVRWRSRRGAPAPAVATRAREAAAGS